MSSEDTVVAIATPPGRGGIGVIRLSGPLSRKICKKITKKDIEPGRFLFTKFYRTDETIIDSGICLFFQSPHSYTGEDVAEFQTHGSDPILKSLLEEIISNGARHARPGEFTERAFINNKMDLIQAESVLELINSKSMRAAKSALRSLEGVFSEEIQCIQSALVKAKSLIEAGLDFPDEEDVEIDYAPAISSIDGALTRARSLLNNAETGEALTHASQVVIAGKPNVGKSSLLNKLLGNDVAIVSDISGTTRDVIKQPAYIDGIELLLIDTAGIRQTSDVIEREGVRRSTENIKKADLVLYVVDDDNYELVEKPTCKTFIVRNKIDIRPIKQNIEDQNIVAISVNTGEGMPELIEAIKIALGIDADEENSVVARERHIIALKKIVACLEEAQVFLQKNLEPEVASEQLRQALNHFDEILGKVTADDILGEIFSRFCIGK